MSSPRNYADYLRDILDACDKARQFVVGMDYEQFARDSKTAFAVAQDLAWALLNSPAFLFNR